LHRLGPAARGSIRSATSRQRRHTSTRGTDGTPRDAISTGVVETGIFHPDSVVTHSMQFHNSSSKADGGRGRKMAPVIEVSCSVPPLHLRAQRAVRTIEAISRGAAMMRAMKECIVERHLARAHLRHRAALHLPLVLTTARSSMHLLFQPVAFSTTTDPSFTLSRHTTTLRVSSI
jgi:hypothetical protein